MEQILHPVWEGGFPAAFPFIMAYFFTKGKGKSPFHRTGAVKCAIIAAETALRPARRTPDE
ncbi:MAG: hypothetical protein DBX44_08755 [Oscillospiraceae bacterium]|nr:MAG: hypothetical protein DBX44_08755 [Oscillospiraceae bacterium]